MLAKFNFGRYIQPSVRLRVALIAILAACVIAVFMPLFNAGWVYDDINIVKPSPALDDLAGLGRSISTDLYSQANSRLEVSPYWRPLAMASYWLDTRFGEAPRSLHIGNILLQALAAALLALVIMRMHRGTAGVIAAVLASAWWALHPQNVEVVAWISTRYEILTAIALLGLLLIRWRPGATHAAIFGLIFLMGLFSKEGFGAMLATVVAMDFAERRGIRAAAPRWIAVALAVIIWIALRGLIELKSLDVPPLGSAIMIAINYLEVISIYSGRAFSIPELTISHPFVSSGLFGVLVGGLIFIALAIGAIWWSKSRELTTTDGELEEDVTSQENPKGVRRLAVPAAIFLAGLVPMAGAITLFSEAPERYFYLPSIGLALIIAELIALAMSTRQQWLRFAVPSLVGVIVIVGLTFVVQRVPDWKSDDALWASALRADPQDAQANYKRAIVSGKQGNWARAREAISIATSKKPDSASFANTYAWVLLRTSDFPGAVREARRATSLAPYLPDGWYYLANALHQLGDHKGELAALDMLLEISPNYPGGQKFRELAACEASGRRDCHRRR